MMTSATAPITTPIPRATIVWRLTIVMLSAKQQRAGVLDQFLDAYQEPDRF
jgi:hypothetical protein